MKTGSVSSQFQSQNPNLPPVILASQSPRRIELLKQTGLSFEAIPSQVEEITHQHLTAAELCQINAYRKARFLSKKFPDMLIIGADTLVALNQEIFGKPGNSREALEMLEKLQGRAHQVVTGVCLLYLRRHRQRIFAETTTVTLHRLHPRQIADYHSKVNPLDKAGAYAIQEETETLLKGLRGSLSNVIGLPMERLETELVAFARELK